jgi:hypothetical protein
VKKSSLKMGKKRSTKMGGEVPEAVLTWRKKTSGVYLITSPLTKGIKKRRKRATVSVDDGVATG